MALTLAYMNEIRKRDRNKLSCGTIYYAVYKVSLTFLTVLNQMKTNGHIFDFLQGLRFVEKKIVTDFFAFVRTTR